MDPNEALRVLRAMVEAVMTGDGCASVDELAEQFDALDEWIARGGFLPAAWSPAAVRAS